jgi:two-component system cell cycle sensor histidine kinase/response regulator CckA
MSAYSNGSSFAPDAYQQYVQLLATIDGIVWEADAQTFQFVFVSSQAERLLGHPLEQWLQPGFWADHIHPEDRDWAVALCRQATREMRKHDFEHRMLAADGRTVWLRNIVTVVVEGGEAARLRGIMVDVTDRKRTEEALRESEELYRLLTEHSNDLIYLVGLDGQIVYASPSVGRLLGRVPRSKFEVVHPEDIEAGQVYWERILRGGKGLLTIRVADAKGTWHWLEAWSSLIPYHGQPHVLSVCRDITERKRAEADLRASEARFRVFVDHATDAFFLHDADGTVLDVNHQACESLGYTRDELIGMSPHQFDVDLDLAVLAQFAARLDAGEMFTFDTHHRRKDGTVFAAEVRVRPFWEGGRRFGISLARDITERKRAEEALRRNDAYLAEAQRLGRSGSWAWDVATREFVHWSREHYRLHGLDPQQGTPSWETAQGFIHPDDRARCLEQIERAIQGRTDCELDYRAALPDGTIKYIHSISHPVFNAAGELVEFVGTEQDITERKRAEEALRESQEQLRLAVQATNLGPWDWDLHTDDVDFSPEWKRQLGYEPHEVPGRYEEWENRLHPEDRERVLGVLRAYLDGHQPEYAVEFRLRHKDGSYRWIYTRAIALRDAAGKPYRMLGCHLDVTERKRAEQALRESHGLLKAVVEGTSDAVFLKDLNGRYLMINSAGARFLGKSVGEVLGKLDQDILPPDARKAIRERELQVMATGQEQTFEQTVTVAGATRTYLATKSAFRDAQGNVIGVVGIARDVTELKGLEEQFRQAQKMEAVGRLAGGVAHDFNNLLTVINGYSAVAFSGLRAEDPNRELLAQVQQAGERAVNLTRQLLAFSRKQMLQPQVVNLNEVLVELHKLLKRLIGEDVELALVQAPDLGLAKVDPGQFEQAVINLAVNARDAMPQGGRLTIETRNAELDEDYAERHSEVRPGHYVLVAVSDTGHGMDEATKARIFEPFFTTKEVGKGTGLGLAMVYGFVKQSEGHVEVQSEGGHGTTLKVYLPRAEATVPSAKSLPGLLKVPTGTETVLLVEDEDAVRALSRLILQSSGYTVLEARDGQEGAWVAQQHPGPIHLLVTDLVMPRMSGRRLAEVLTEAWPHLRVLFLSGYTDELLLQHGVPDTGFAFLQKPFSPISLARKVREVLDAKER